MRLKCFSLWESIFVYAFLLGWIVLIVVASILVAIDLTQHGGDWPLWEAAIAWAVIIGPFIAIIVFSLACGAAVWLGLRWLFVKKLQLDRFVVKAIALLLGVMITIIIFIEVLGHVLGKYVV